MSVEREITSRVQSMPMLPVAVTRVFRLVSNPSCSASDVEEAIRPDAALTANLLRVVNSAAFGLTRNFGSVRQAVALLGTRRVLESVTGLSVQRVVPTRLPGYGISATSFWNHCLAVAVIAELLGKDLKEDRDLAFTAGLLHDVGKLAIAAFLLEAPNHEATRFEGPAESFLAAEEQALGTSHATLGEVVSRHWNLPEPIVVCARWHHSPEGAGVGPHRALIDVIHVSDNLAHLLGYGDLGELGRVASAPSVDRLRVTPSVLEHVASDALPRIRALSQTFHSAGAPS